MDCIPANLDLLLHSFLCLQHCFTSSNCFEAILPQDDHDLHLLKICQNVKSRQIHAVDLICSSWTFQTSLKRSHWYVDFHSSFNSSKLEENQGEDKQKEYDKEKLSLTEWILPKEKRKTDSLQASCLWSAWSDANLPKDKHNALRLWLEQRGRFLSHVSRCKRILNSKGHFRWK